MILVCVLLVEIEKKEEEDQFTVKDNIDIRKSYVNKLLPEIRRVCQKITREGFTVSLVRKLAEKEKTILNQTKPKKSNTTTPQNRFTEECI